ncbi:hypothetical protein GALMADRAFT_885615 [Galerina marginata CBS 339.88]|uniref:F-box domain-containing protein n=1 Tax=Galerina marginata (strain CBS 339.88) TaxID=685588 RepID=A0A067SUQ0_GALM3|nr:hypothetical protein GALMADRAFT_885615 [Galerina marginata CBS 339.88]
MLKSFKYQMSITPFRQTVTPLGPYRDVRPISRLNYDILWQIFNLNTLTDTDIVQNDSENHEMSLITARHTSQVCADWRSLMLASSSLWANTINLQHLNQRNDDWRGEILKRTTNSLLTIIGHLEAGWPTSQFFLSLLDGQWTRLRRISVHVHGKAVAKDKRWLSIQSPAPNLEIFCIRFVSTSAFSTLDDTLFSDTAPSIHTLITHNINFKFSGRWLSSLHSLDLSGCSVRKTILFALADMLSLESLNMTNVDIVDTDAEDHSWPMIILPQLKLLSLSVDLGTLAVLIGYIAPTPRCIFKYEYSNSTIAPPSANDIFLLLRGLSAHFQCFFDFWLYDMLFWTMTKYMIDLKTDCSGLFFHIDIDSGSDWHGIPDIILHSLHYCNLSSITNLELHVSPDPLDPSNVQLSELCRSLSPVEVMHTDSQIMEVLIQLQEELDGMTLFPNLHSVVFDTDAELKCDAIQRFILQRRDAGVPIAEFDLSDCTSPNQDRLLFLEGINGLDVEWNQDIRNGM